MFLCTNMFFFFRLAKANQINNKCQLTVFFDRKTQFFTWKTWFIVKTQSFDIFFTQSVNSLYQIDKQIFWQKMCFSIEKHCLSVDNQCSSNRKAEFFDKLCFPIEKKKFFQKLFLFWQTMFIDSKTMFFDLKKLCF